MLFSHNYDTMLQALFKPYGACRATDMFNTRQLRRVSQLKAFTDAPLNFYREQPFVWMFRGCIPVFMTSLHYRCLRLVFSFPYFLFLFSVYSHPGCQSSSRPLVFLREILWFTSILHSPQWLGLCVPLVISIQSPHSATYFTVSHIKTCTMALKVSFSG